MDNPALTIFDNAVFETIRKDFTVEILERDCRFTEGPVWNKEGFYLFSDIPANCVYRIRPGHKKEVFISPSGTDHPQDPLINRDQPGSNGLAYAPNGDLLLCQHGGHAVANYDGKRLVPVITSYENKPLNSPNDLIVHSDGRIFFSDPPYGLKDGKLNPEKFQQAARVYQWEKGTLKIICDAYLYPNGVCLSPDQKKLYICSSKPFEKFILVYDTVTGKISGPLAEENSDGIKCDPKGNLFLANKEGILMLNQQGKRLGLIALPKVPANLCWGGKSGDDLFITAREEVYLIRGLGK